MSCLSYSKNALKLFASVALLSGGITLQSAFAQARALRCASTVTSTELRYSSVAGDLITGGVARTLNPSNAAFSISGNGEYLTLSVVPSDNNYFGVTIRAPEGEILKPGLYGINDSAELAYTPINGLRPTGRAPGITFVGNRQYCNAIWGRFNINQIGFDSSGQVNMVDGTFIQRCNSSTAPAPTVTFKYNAPPLFYSYNSDAAHPIGLGASKTYVNANSTIRVGGNFGFLTLAVSGERDRWDGYIAPPTGQTFKPGVYNLARFSDATKAGIDLKLNGRGCNVVTGTLNICDLTTITTTGLYGNQYTDVKTFSASYQIFCNGQPAALNGSIRYFK